MRAAVHLVVHVYKGRRTHLAVPDAVPQKTLCGQHWIATFYGDQWQRPPECKVCRREAMKAAAQCRSGR